MTSVPSGFFAFKRLSATGFMFEPSAATATPPNAPVLPPNTAPREAGVRISGMGGRLNERTLLATDAAFTSRVASYETRQKRRLPALSLAILDPGPTPFETSDLQPTKNKAAPT